MMFISLLSYWIMYALISTYMVSADNYDNMAWYNIDLLVLLGIIYIHYFTLHGFS
jgi:hypothetical protein